MIRNTGQPTSTVEQTDKGDKKVDENLARPDSKSSRDVFFRLQEYAYRKFPWIISDPKLHERLTAWRKRDEKDNTKSTPPEQERIRSRCIWAVEFYTPSQISALFRGFVKLGWITNDHGVDRNPALWIQRNRLSAQAGGWFNLGIIRPLGTETRFILDRTGPLPAGVEYAIASLYSLTSSLTCIIMCFALDEMQASRVEQVLRKNRETNMLQLSGQKYRIEDPASQKESEIGVIRATMREVASGWFRQHLPGIFATGALQGEHPTCEFLTLSDCPPFPPQELRDSNRNQWLSVLGIDYASDLWVAKECPSLKFALPFTRDEGMRYHAIIACKEDELLNELKHPYGADQSSMVFHVDEHINGLLSRWAVLGVLSSFERYLNSTRDSAAFDRKKRTKPIRLLNDLGSYFAKSVDIAVVSFELSQFAEDQNLFKHRVSSFLWWHPKFLHDDKTPFSEALRLQVEKRAPLLCSIDRSVRDILIQYGNAIGVRENLRLQTRISTLTWLVVALTVVTAFLAFVSTFPNSLTG